MFMYFNGMCISWTHLLHYDLWVAVTICVILFSVKMLLNNMHVQCNMYFHLNNFVELQVQWLIYLNFVYAVISYHT